MKHIHGELCEIILPNTVRKGTALNFCEVASTLGPKFYGAGDMRSGGSAVRQIGRVAGLAVETSQCSNTTPRGLQRRTRSAQEVYLHDANTDLFCWFSSMDSSKQPPCSLSIRFEVPLFIILSIH